MDFYRGHVVRTECESLCAPVISLRKQTNKAWAWTARRHENYAKKTKQRSINSLGEKSGQKH